MGKQILIANDNGFGRIFLFLIIFAISSFLFRVLFSVESDKYIIIILIIIAFIILFFRDLYFSRKVFVDLVNKNICITSTPFNIYRKILAFDSIKSIIFYEKEYMGGENNEKWEKLIEITGINNDILYKTKVIKIINYSLFVKLCNEYFQIDYIVVNLEI